MDTEQMTAKQVFEEYKEDMKLLIGYLPWLIEKSGKGSVSSNYSGDGLIQNTLSFPVYDSTLMRFIKDAGKTGLIDRNYVYVIRRNLLEYPVEEIQFVKEQDLFHMKKNVGGVLSKYVLEGQSKGRLWSQAMDEGVFLAIVEKLKEIYDYWDNALGENNQ